MGFLSYITPARLRKEQHVQPSAVQVQAISSSASTHDGTVDSLEQAAEFDYKYDLMLEYLHQQQTNFRWTSGGRDEGVIMKKAKDTYICLPPALNEVEDGFRSHIQALNVRVAMTVNTPVIKRFAGRSIVSLADGQHLQVLPDMTWLSRCQKYQSAAFISDIGRLVVWTDDPTEIIERVSRLERELLNIIWQADLNSTTIDEKKENITVNVSEVSSEAASISDVEAGSEPTKSPRVQILQPFGIACALALGFSAMGSGLAKLVVEASWDGQYIRFALLLLVPFLTWFSLFFFQALACSIIQMIGPIRQMHQNSKFYSGLRPQRLGRYHPNGLPHVTIQMPVYKEGLEAVIVPTIRSIKAAIATYEMQGGTANIFVNDDGMQLISSDMARARQDFYDENNIGWVARPKHNEDPDAGPVFLRRGKFKKASNMNYALWVSTRVEDKLAMLDDDEHEDSAVAYRQVLDEVVAEDEGRTWATGNVRFGDYILIIDSDTRVPRDCLLDSVSEMEHNPRCAVLQHASSVMNVTDSYFEMGITHFTNLVYDQIRYAVSSGDCAPFVGHNAFLRWNALQYISYECEDDHREKWWSESSVSEDFDMSLRLQAAGYLIRLAAYTSPDGELFQEGVSLTVYDELTRWEKYAYGCSELMFHPLKDWFRHGPITPIFRTFLRSRMPLASKFTLMAYIGTYYAIAMAWIGSLVNYFMVGWYLPKLDRFYYQSFSLFFAIIMVFTLLGNVCLAVMRFRADNKPLLGGLLENFKWVPMMTIFMGGMSMHVSQALLSHLFSIDMSWGATAKELTDSTFFEELGKVAKKFKFTFAYSIFCIAMMVVLALFVPENWRIDTFAAIWPMAINVCSHILLPVALNPSLMLFAF